MGYYKNNKDDLKKILFDDKLSCTKHFWKAEALSRVFILPSEIHAHGKLLLLWDVARHAVCNPLVPICFLPSDPASIGSVVMTQC